MRVTSDIRSLSDPAEIMQSARKTMVLKILKPTTTKPFLRHSSSLFFRKQHMPGYIYQDSIHYSPGDGRLLPHPLSWVQLTAWLSHWAVLAALPGWAARAGQPFRAHRREQGFSFINQPFCASVPFSSLKFYRYRK